MKPHMRFKKGVWQVWHDKSACPWQLPAVQRVTMMKAYAAYVHYTGWGT